ncbi:MAG TPA: hypothetical protein VK302_03735 [Terriglobales bacterium]|nr:hypothetical protein [Terriglobales bacterium]
MPFHKLARIIYNYRYRDFRPTGIAASATFGTRVAAVLEKYLL